MRESELKDKIILATITDSILKELLSDEYFKKYTNEKEIFRKKSLKSGQSSKVFNNIIASLILRYYLLGFPLLKEE